MSFYWLFVDRPKRRFSVFSLFSHQNHLLWRLFSSMGKKAKKNTRQAWKKSEAAKEYEEAMVQVKEQERMEQMASENLFYIDTNGIRFLNSNWWVGSDKIRKVLFEEDIENPLPETEKRIVHNLKKKFEKVLWQTNWMMDRRRLRRLQRSLHPAKLLKIFGELSLRVKCVGIKWSLRKVRFEEFPPKRRLWDFIQIEKSCRII